MLAMVTAGVLATGSAAWAQSGGSGTSGGSSSNNGGAKKDLRVGPNAKLGDDKHNVTLAAKFQCKNNAKYTVQGKARQGSAVGKGTSTLQCEKGATKTITVVATDSAHEFATGEADGCVAVVKKGSDAKPKPECRKVTVVA